MAMHLVEYGKGARNGLSHSLGGAARLAVSGAPLLPVVMANNFGGMVLKDKPNETLEVVGENVWQIRGWLWRPFKLEIRMTIVRLECGGLLLHSPLEPQPLTLSEVRRLGPVRYIVAPSLMHDKFSKFWKVLYPEARVVCPRGCMRHLRRSVAVDGALEDELPSLGITVHDHSQSLLHPHVTLRVPITGGGDALLFSDHYQNHQPSTVWGRMPSGMGGLRVTRFFRIAGTRDEKSFMHEMVELTRPASTRALLFCHGPPVVGAPEIVSALMLGSLARSFHMNVNDLIFREPLSIETVPQGDHSVLHGAELHGTDQLE